MARSGYRQSPTDTTYPDGIAITDRRRFYTTSRDTTEVYGVESICKVLPIALWTYYLSKSRALKPETRPEREKRGARLRVNIGRIGQSNRRVYGVRKVWRQPKREDIAVACCTVAGLMRSVWLQGVTRGKQVKTTWLAGRPACPMDLVRHDFMGTRPKLLCVADMTYVATWQGFGYVAFVIDAYVRRIVCWRVSGSLRAGLVLDAREQAVWGRRPAESGPIVHYCDRGVQYESIRYAERLGDDGIEPSVGTDGDSYDNALAESSIGLYKTEVIRREGPRRGAAAVGCATLDWVDWINHRRLLEPIGDITAAEKEQAYYHQLTEPALAA